MLKQLVQFGLVLLLLYGCVSGSQPTEEPETLISLQESKLDSIRSVITMILDDGEALLDTRSNIESGTYSIDENAVIRAINFSVKEVIIDEVSHPLAIDLINLEKWDSTSNNSIEVDSAFLLSNISHLALAKITIGSITNEVLFPMHIVQDSVQASFEGKTTFKLRDWGFERPESHKMHMGLLLYAVFGN